MSDLGDFLGDHPVPQPPVKVVQRDLALDAFRSEASERAAKTPTAGARRSGFKLEVAQQPCKAGACRHPPGTLCGSVDYIPDPSLDEIGVGWTAQHIPVDGRREVSFHCILCWALIEPSVLHLCPVASVLQWTEVSAEIAR